MKLTHLEARWLNAFANAIAPPMDGDGDGTRLVVNPGEVDYRRTFESLNAPAGLKVRAGLHALLAAMALSPVWHRGQLTTFDKLPANEAESLMVELESHRFQVVRELMMLMKVQVSMALFGTPSIRKKSGYDRDRDQKTPVRLRLKTWKHSGSNGKEEAA